ncbi:MAG: hypothetical protein AUH11_02180 [Acidobacteria bacterium 13_2_20CM_57_17]|nr:MAG: hypothetical protein AUH11_02180 [Acidobacteria bacterium 13_2_20CM_57_17]OLB93356.1 MAG: hypothetical protein AUI02_06745 [Acidobacteria bacterium 13_2_20CM_2_57_12]OLE16107.1 MAG: hypothetical protein AUG83_04420 [Acidobacteria bacterium 13_1_20CM_4_57_11]
MCVGGKTAPQLSPFLLYLLNMEFIRSQPFQSWGKTLEALIIESPGRTEGHQAILFVRKCPAFADLLSYLFSLSYKS